VTGALWARVALIVCAAVATYANSLSIPFVLDDQASVVQNGDIRDLRNLARVLQPTPDSPTAGRPLVSLSFALNYAAGGLDPVGYHLVNLILHTLCALMAFGLVRRTLELPSMRDRWGRVSADVAAAAALLWVVHPLTSEVVNYVTQRTESMAALCLLVTMYGAVRASTSPQGRWDGVAIVACFLGTLCKETIVVTPVLVALFDRLFLVGSWRQAYRDRGSLYLGLMASWFVLAGLLWSGPRSAVGGFSAGVDVWTYLLNQAVVIVDYLQKTIWPVRLVAFYGWPLPLTLAQVWPQAAVVLALLVATAVACVKAPRLGYLGAWFFITLAPTSSFVPIATEVGAERRMYLPLMALATLAVAAAWGLLGRLRALDANHRGTTAPGWASAALTLGVAGGLATATVARNREYATPITLAQTIVDRRPSGVAHHMLGEQLAIANRVDEAVGHLRQAVAQGNTRAHYPLGVLLLQRRDVAGATQQLEEVVRLSGVPQAMRWLEPPLLDVLQARGFLGQIYATERRWADAEVQAREVLAKAPGHPDARRVLGAALVGQQRWAESIDEHRQYLKARPGDAQARVNLGVAFIATGQLDAAIDQFQQAVAADPGNPNARRLLQLAREDRARAVEAK